MVKTAPRGITRPRSISIYGELERRVELYAAQNGFRSFSAAVCAVLEEHLEELPASERRKLSVAMKQSKAAPRKMTVCPSCGDSSNFVTFPNGKWRCNLCMQEGEI